MQEIRRTLCHTKHARPNLHTFNATRRANSPIKIAIRTWPQICSTITPAKISMTLLRQRKLWLVILCTVALAVGAAKLVHVSASQPTAKLSSPKASARKNSASSAPDLGDRFDDGTPNFLRLDSPSDQDAFRRRFVLIADSRRFVPRKISPRKSTIAPRSFAIPIGTPFADATTLGKLKIALSRRALCRRSKSIAIPPRRSAPIYSASAPANSCPQI